MKLKFTLRGLELPLYLCFSTLAFGQTAPAVEVSTPPENASYRASITAYQSEQASLSEERSALLAQGATTLQLAAWYKTNAGLINTQRQRAAALALAADAQPRSLVPKSRAEASALPALKAFLETQRALANSRTQIHNSLLRSTGVSPGTLTTEQAASLAAQERQLFQQQNAALIHKVGQQQKALSAENARTAPAVPGLAIPRGATPEMTAYLTARHQLVSAQQSLSEQMVTAAPAEKQAALSAWRQQHATQINQVEQQAADLSTTTVTTQN